MALWNFEDGTARDVTGHGHDGTLRGHAVVVVGQPALPETPSPIASEQPSSGPEPVLDLDGRSGRVELPPNIWNGLKAVTIEGWVKWRRFDGWPRLFTFGKGENDIILAAGSDTNRIDLILNEKLTGGWVGQSVLALNAMTVGAWVHVAGVFTTSGATLLVNGQTVGSNPNLLRSRVKEDTENVLGSTGNGNGGLLDGQMDEVRFWKGARTEAQIRENMFKSLTGREEGLLSLWNFNNVTNAVVKDLGPGGFDGRVVGGARQVGADRPTVPWASIAGQVLNSERGPAAGARILLTRDDGRKSESMADALGRYAFTTLAPSHVFQLSVQHRWESLILSNIVLQSDERRELNLQLVAMFSVSGRVQTREGKPRAGVLLELVADEVTRRNDSPNDRRLTPAATNIQVLAVSLTQADGTYHFRRVESGSYRLRAQGAAGFEWYQDGKVIVASADTRLTGLDFTLEPVAANVSRPSPSPSDRLLTSAATTNRVLSLKGDGVNTGYVELPSDIFNNLEGTTVEGWLKWDRFRNYSRFFDFGNTWRAIAVSNRETTNTLYVTLCRPPFTPQSQLILTVPGIIQTNEWCHIALVTGSGGVRLYFNGALMTKDDETGSFASVGNGDHNYLGRSNWRDRPGFGNDEDFEGEMEEVRVWSVQRTGDQIRENMFRRLKGDEEGLAALWNFDDPNELGRDASPHGFNGRAIGATNIVGQLPKKEALVSPLSLSGVVTDKDGRAVGNAIVQVEQQGRELATITTDFSGKFLVAIGSSSLTNGVEALQLRARKGDLSCQPIELPGRSAEDVAIVIRDLASLSGRVLALDESPLPGVVVQAVPVTEEGENRREQPGLWGEYFQLGEKPERIPELAADARPTSVRAEPTLNFPRVNGGPSLGRGERNGELYARWTGKLRLDQARRIQLILAVEDTGRVFVDGKLVIDTGLPKPWSEKSVELELTSGDHALKIDYLNTEGWNGCQLWWSADGRPREIVPASMLVHEGGAPATVATLTDQRGRFRFIDLPPGDYTLRAHVPASFVAPDAPGPVTITKDQAVTGMDFHLSPFKKGRWQHWTHAEGLPDDNVRQLFQDRSGAMWFATVGGVARFDGRDFRSWTTRDGLPVSSVRCVSEGEPGVMWFGTSKGLVRHDARDSRQPFTLFTTTNGLPDDVVTALERDPAGRLWIGTTNGLARFDGTNFVVFSGGLVPDAGPGAHNGRLMGSAKLAQVSRPSGPPEPVKLAGETKPGTNWVLELDGTNSFVELPPNIFNQLTEATVEGWIKWDAFGVRTRFFDFGKPDQTILLSSDNGGDLRYLRHRTHEDYDAISIPKALRAGEWVHLAAISGSNGMKLYLNGQLVGDHPSTGSFSGIGNNDHNFLGRSVWEENAFLRGAMGEVRVWKVARTAEQIRANISRNLSGQEEGLVGLWNFDNVTNGVVKDLSPGGHDGLLKGNATVTADATLDQMMRTPMKTETVLATATAGEGYVALGTEGWSPGTNFTEEAWIFPSPANKDEYQPFLGNTTDASGATRPPGLLVYWQTGLQCCFGNGKQWLGGNTATNLLTPGAWNHVAATYDGTAYRIYVNGQLVDTKQITGVPLATPMPWRLGEYYSGQMDEVRVWNVARSQDQIRQTLYENLSGQEPGLISLWNFDQPSKPAPKGNAIAALLSDTNGVLWVGTDAGVARFDGTNWVNYSADDGLAKGAVIAIQQARDGSLWFGTENGATHLQFLDTQSAPQPPKAKLEPDNASTSFTTYTTQDGLPHNRVAGIAEDAEGNLWFACGPLNKPTTRLAGCAGSMANPSSTSPPTTAWPATR